MKKPSKSALITALTFLLVVVGAELGARALAPGLPVDPGKWPRAEMAQKLEQMREYVDDDRSVDVVFIGSSMMAGGVDPVEFSKVSGLSAYNAAFSGPSMRVLTPWTLDIVEPLLKPDVVVVGVSSRELSDNSEQGLKIYGKFLASPGYREASSSIGAAVAGRLERLSYFLNYRRAFREPTEIVESGADFVAGNKIKTQVGSLGRRVTEPRNYWIPDQLTGMLRRQIFTDFTVGGPEYEELKDLHDSLEKRGIRMVLVNMPVTNDYRAVHREGEWESYLTVLERFVDETGVRLLDAHDAFPKRVFRNPLHLDVDARYVFGRALGERWTQIISGNTPLRLVCDKEPDCSLRNVGSLAER